jgi:hypothetical protein
LAGRKNAFLDVALGAIHEGLHFVGIETYLGWAIGIKFLGRHGVLSFEAVACRLPR